MIPISLCLIGCEAPEHSRVVLEDKILKYPPLLFIYNSFFAHLRDNGKEHPGLGPDMSG